MPSGHTERRQSSGATGGRSTYRIRQEGITQPSRAYGATAAQQEPNRSPGILEGRQWGHRPGESVGAGAGPDSRIRPRRRGEGGGAEETKHSPTQAQQGPIKPRTAAEEGRAAKREGGAARYGSEGKGRKLGTVAAPAQRRKEPAKPGRELASELSERSQQASSSYRTGSSCLCSMLAQALPSVHRRGPAYPAAGRDRARGGGPIDETRGAESWL